MPHKKGKTRREYDRQYYRKKRAEGKWTVYKLKDGYVGISKYVERRMKEHRNQGNDTEGYKVIAKFKRPEPAIIVEAIYHWMGYKGCAYGK